MAHHNQQVWSWFDRHQIKEAILGQNEYFIPNVTYRDKHARTLILRQLFLWSKDRSTETEAAQGIVDAIDEVSRQVMIWDVFDIVWVYLMTIDDMKYELPVSLEVLRQVIRQTTLDHPSACTEDMKLLIQAVNNRLNIP